MTAIKNFKKHICGQILNKFIVHATCDMRLTTEHNTKPPPPKHVCLLTPLFPSNAHAFVSLLALNFRRHVSAELSASVQAWLLSRWLVLRQGDVQRRCVPDFALLRLRTTRAPPLHGRITVFGSLMMHTRYVASEESSLHNSRAAQQPPRLPSRKRRDDEHE